MLGRGCLRALQANPAARVSSKGVRAAFAAGSNGRAPTTQTSSQPSSTWSPITPLWVRSMTPTLQNAGCQVTPVRFYSDDNFPEHVKVNLPALSPTMELGTIVSWEKKEGDAVAEGDLLCEIETDKATMGFETPEEGYLAKVILPAGSKDIPIGRLLCIITPNAEDVAKFKDYVAPAEPETGSPAKTQTDIAPEPEPLAPKVSPIIAQPPPARITGSPATAPRVGGAVASGSARPFASPAAKRVAAERGVDLFQIAQGSGMDGMITAKDVENFVPVGVPAAAAVPLSVPSTAAPQTAPGQTAFRTSGGTPALMGGHSDADITNMRRVIGKRLQASKMEVPHYYLTLDIEMDKVMALRKEINTSYEKEGIKVSVNDFIIKATALACRQVPAVNSHWMDTFIREHHTCDVSVAVDTGNGDVSVAVDTGNGLITPIVTSAEAKGLAEISHSVREMAGRAKEGKLQPHEFQGGTITVSNLGMFGVSHFTAIINSPQSCILAVGATKAKVLVGEGGAPKTANVMTVTLSCDHRVVDGAVGAQWLQKFKKFIEQPNSMLL